MSKYTTGEIARLCGVTVRTVQYYDSRNLLVPSTFSEGGRRLYSEEDLQRLKVICFLRELDLPISAIAQLLAEDDPGNVINLLLEQQQIALESEIEQRKRRLSKLKQLQHEIKGMTTFSVESIGDIARIMEGKRNLRRLRFLLLAVGIPLDIAQIATIILWVTKGIWWPFLLWVLMDILLGGAVAMHYMKCVAYICPHCHETFRPGFWENLFARHTPKTRKLNCPNCGQNSFCVEIYGGAPYAEN